MKCKRTRLGTSEKKRRDLRKKLKHREGNMKEAEGKGANTDWARRRTQDIKGNRDRTKPILLFLRYLLVQGASETSEEAR